MSTRTRYFLRSLISLALPLCYMAVGLAESSYYPAVVFSGFVLGGMWNEILDWVSEAKK